VYLWKITPSLLEMNMLHTEKNGLKRKCRDSHHHHDTPNKKAVYLHIAHKASIIKKVKPG
jgi:hypothetical protein